MNKGLLRNLGFVTGAFILLSGCRTDYASLSLYSNAGVLQAVIEVPAGSNHQMRYDPETKDFVAARRAGADMVIDFLPYPGNYGFIPSTLVDEADNGYPHPLRILVIAESVPTGTVMEVQPVGALLLDKAGKVEHLIVAVPAKPSEQVMAAPDYATLSKKYPGAKLVIQQWFMHANPEEKTKVMGWKDEAFAEEQISRWMR
jgi:inorganic pyrophosphatase